MADGTLKVGTITTSSGSGTVTVPSGVTFNVAGTLQSGGSAITQGITEADQWRITADHTGVGDITANWERNDTQFSYIGSCMTESSGIFTFPSTGIYLVMGSATGSVGGGASQFVNLTLYNTINNSTYSNVAMAYSHAYTADSYFSMQVKAILDVTDTSNVKVKLGIAQNQANSVFVQGATNRNMTYMTFIRLGDT